MAEIIIELFQRFSFETGISGEVRQYGQIGMMALIMLGAFALVMGFKTYRIFFSLVLFICITVLSSVLLSGKANWGEITTFFSVVGTIVALLAYQCYKMGGCVICGLIGGIFGWILTDSIGIALLFCALAIIATLKFPVITICLFTSLFGSLIICELLLTSGNPFVISAICASGYAVQMLINRRQKIFAKIYPDKVTHWLEKKKRKTYADSI
ncbi:MAG: hypothetical protein PHX08_05505 [Lachnospiraceae bacterium]|nr:hypothetical protein [Lachnospiraceae bacterium]